MILDPLERSYAEAEAVTARWARTFHFASRFLPPARRRAVVALYDYCRHADNLVDQRGDRPVAAVRADLAALAAQVRAMHAGAPPEERRWLALHDVLRRHDVPLAPLLELLEGVATDLGPVSMPDFAALERYCVQVAGGVGLALAPLLGAQPDPAEQAAGVRIGIAMQLTNILRDVREDLDRDRVYLPATELAEWGLGRADLERRELTPPLREFLAFQVARARRYFASGEAAIACFPDDGARLTVQLMVRAYAGILDALERQDLDVFRARAHVPLGRKLVILGRAVLGRRSGLAGAGRD